MQKILRQGELDFAPGYKMQTRWGALEAAVFTLECAGAGLFCASVLFLESPAALLAGAALVALAILLLLGHLSHPARAWRALRNLRHSWISRGTVVLGAFVVLAAACAALGAGASGAEQSGLGALAAWTALAAGAFILLYPGLVLSASPAIALWNTGLSPVVSAASGAASGAALALAAAASAGGGQLARFVQLATLQAWLLAILAILVFLYLAVMQRRGGTAAVSAACLLRREAWLFVVAGGVLGIALPLLLTLGILHARLGFDAALLAAAARLAGDFALRYALLRAGLFSPPV
ncbi:MAG: polysulfide reductase NrfD [Burkholderiales bacterium]|nr:polysulfide reductase NrfD [Burkholderiales bacterium]